MYSIVWKLDLIFLNDWQTYKYLISNMQVQVE